MNARTWISLVNLLAIVVAFVVLFTLPQYSNYIFYALLTWILVGFVLLYALRTGRSTPTAGPRAGSTGPSAPLASSPLPSSGSPGPATSLDFCIYCGTALPAGSTTCRACGHPVRAL